MNIWYDDVLRNVPRNNAEMTLEITMAKELLVVLGIEHQELAERPSDKTRNYWLINKDRIINRW